MGSQQFLRVCKPVCHLAHAPWYTTLCAACIPPSVRPAERPVPRLRSQAPRKSDPGQARHDSDSDLSPPRGAAGPHGPETGVRDRSVASACVRVASASAAPGVSCRVVGLFVGGGPRKVASAGDREGLWRGRRGQHGTSGWVRGGKRVSKGFLQAEGAGNWRRRRLQGELS